MITLNKPSLWERLKRWMGFQPTYSVTGALFTANKDGDYELHGNIIPKVEMERALKEFKDRKGQVTYIMHADPTLSEAIKKGHPIGVSVEGFTTGRFNTKQPNKSAPPKGKG